MFKWSNKFAHLLRNLEMENDKFIEFGVTNSLPFLLTIY
jgi:hypothetical protein